MTQFSFAFIIKAFLSIELYWIVLIEFLLMRNYIFRFKMITICLIAKMIRIWFIFDSWEMTIVVFSSVLQTCRVCVSSNSITCKPGSWFSRSFHRRLVAHTEFARKLHLVVVVENQGKRYLISDGID